MISRAEEQSRTREAAKYRKVFTELDIEYTGDFDVDCRTLIKKYEDLQEMVRLQRRQLDQIDKESRQKDKDARSWRRLCDKLQISTGVTVDEIEEMIREAQEKANRYEAERERNATQRMQMKE